MNFPRSLSAPLLRSLCPAALYPTALCPRLAPSQTGAVYALPHALGEGDKQHQTEESGTDRNSRADVVPAVPQTTLL